MQFFISSKMKFLRFFSFMYVLFSLLDPDTAEQNIKAFPDPQQH